MSVNQDPEPDVREGAIYALGSIGEKDSISVQNEIASALLKILYLNNKSSVRHAAVINLEMLLLQSSSHSKSFDSILPDILKEWVPEEISRLMNALNHSQMNVVESAAFFLKYAARPHDLKYLWEKYLQLELPSLRIAIIATQSRCGFYNYEIAQSSPPPPINSEKISGNGSPTYNFYNSVGNVAHNNYGNQITNQQTDLNEQE